MEPSSGAFTRLVSQLRDGDHQAEAKLYELVYSELRQLAARYLARERPNHTLQPTALVNEVCVRLLGSQTTGLQNRAHFFALASRAMRHILVDHARSHRAEKRGGEIQKVQIDESVSAVSDRSGEAFAASSDRLDQVILVSAAIDRLTERHPRAAKVIELRFFGGLTEEEAAEVLGITGRTAHRDWQFARAWLQRDLSTGA